MPRTELVLLTLLSLAFANSSVAKAPVSLEQCAKITGDKQRLTCFDTLAAEELAGSATESESGSNGASSDNDTADNAEQSIPQQAANSAAPQSAAQKKRQFGLENRPEPGEEINEISSRVVSVEENRRGNRIYTLANGMVWQQKKKEYFHGEVDDIAVVKRGFMGVFYLGIEGTSRRTKVERLK
ncbi:hypothetical protein [Salinimonas chungwhensis]|uniref:hypothetical protein n=1 Tax=Salinimonas chungwhensis TaxID=265425 RepID=UPI00039C749C|nr:hypothetical protein [Salinimonas chungwhensis]